MKSHKQHHYHDLNSARILTSSPNVDQHPQSALCFLLSVFLFSKSSTSLVHTENSSYASRKITISKRTSLQKQYVLFKNQIFMLWSPRFSFITDLDGGMNWYIMSVLSGKHNSLKSKNSIDNEKWVTLSHKKRWNKQRF